MALAAALAATASAADRVAAYDFSRPADAWAAGFADHPSGVAYDWRFAYGYERLPENLTLKQNGLYIAGHNYGADLFMYFKVPVAGLLPATAYSLTFTVDLITDAPSGCAGIGGPPGEAVSVKVGAVPFEPVPLLDDRNMVRLNLETGNQQRSGLHAITIGHIGNRNTDCAAPVWEVKTLESPPFTTTTDPNGRLWLLVGTDSGFEGYTKIYYKAITVRFSGP